MSSYNAAKSIHQEHHLGVIEVGARANFVIVDKKLNILKTYVNGKMLFKH
jgi:N-acetylglucosamine-6-phosphate deacetylase